MAAEKTETAGGLTALDWLVIVAATVSLVVLVWWLYQGQPKPPGTPDPAK